MKYPSVFVSIVLLFLLQACAKVSDFKKSSFSQPLVSAAPARFKDSVYRNNQLYIQRNILYRDSALNFASTDSLRHSLYLDFYCPDFAQDTLQLRPLIVWIHGGSFVFGTKSYDSTLCKMFATHGYAVISIDYRLNPAITQKNQNNTLTAKELYETIYREVQDTRFAVRFVKQAASAQAGRIDTNRIFLAGLSAGAVIALHSAYMEDERVPPSVIDQSVLGKLDYGNTANGPTAKVTVVTAFAGMLTDITLIQPNKTPAICLHSTGDTFFPIDCGAGSLYPQIYVCGGRSIANRLTAVGIPNAFKQFDDPLLPSPPANLSHGSVVQVPSDPSNGQLNMAGLQFMLDILYSAFFSR